MWPQTLTVVAASDTASFALGVRNQGGAPATSGLNNGYGDDALTVGVDGNWEAVRFNDTTGVADTRFSIGFIQPAKSFTLAAEVDGPLMTFSINGQKVTTVVDTTYPDGYGIDFGISDPDAKSPPSALFSHFVYTPLPDTHVTTPATVATATAQAAKDDQAPYMALVPGFGCDKGAGQWKPASQAQDYVTTHCLPNGLAVSQGASVQFAGRVSFYWLNGNFPANYKVKTRIDVSGLNGGCAGIVIRTNEQAGDMSSSSVPTAPGKLRSLTALEMAINWLRARWFSVHRTAWKQHPTVPSKVLRSLAPRSPP